MEQKNVELDKIRGSLVGGAVGDALGYPVEFISSYEGIQRQYGEVGITRYDTSLDWMAEPDGNGKAVISDDTQMTLFTACGLLNAKANGGAPVPSVCRAYIEWYFTQMGKKSNHFKECWLSDIPELYARRAPGNTCLTALADVIAGRETVNNSKGCGGVMRVAPVALYGAAQGRVQNIKLVDRMAADVSELTHQHPLGYIPSALVAHVIYRLVQDEAPTRESCVSYLREGMNLLDELYPEHQSYVADFCRLMELAIRQSSTKGEDAAVIEMHLGGGWTAEETVAIAFYCVLKYFDDFEKAIVAAVNHAGDSDSTGAVAGNILGAVVGYEGIPIYYKKDLELLEVILHVADDLYRGETIAFKREK